MKTEFELYKSAVELTLGNFMSCKDHKEVDGTMWGIPMLKVKVCEECEYCESVWHWIWNPIFDFMWFLRPGDFPIKIKDE